MAGCALAVAKKIGLDAGLSELAITGGLTYAGAALLEPFTRAVEHHLPECTVKLAELSPATGAALLALEMSGKKLKAR